VWVFFFIMEFGVSEFPVGVFDILCKFSQFSIALGAVVVLWFSGGGCYVGGKREHIHNIEAEAPATVCIH
jgi:hypothetical protein